MKYNASPTSCETFSYGEVEDYTVNIVTSARVDEEEIAASKLDFNLYPNPVKGDILNVANLNQAATYKIFNIMGQQVSQGKITENNIQVSELKSGAYLIEITSDNQTVTKRFIKQ